jgi:hypothetical protein
VPNEPSSLHLERLDAAEGVIHLAYYDYETLTGELVAIDETGELLWSSPQPGRIQTLAAIPGGGVIVGGPDSLTHIAADGTTSWTAPSIMPVSIEVSPSGNIVVGGHEPAEPDQTMLVVYSDLGELLESVDVPGSNGQLWDLHFLTERRVFASGTRLSPPTGNGSAQVIDLDTPELGWTREYNRALDSCDEYGELLEQPTWEWFGESAMLSDGTFLVVGAEAGLPQPYTEIGIQPWVMHLDQRGEFLASDRGLWFGQANAVAAGDDGSAYVVATWAGNAGITDYNEAFRGFLLRKYQP